MSNLHVIRHDGVSHHPLGAGSYIFGKTLVSHITQYCTKPRIILHLGAQPNSSPHVGTLVNFCVAFALAKRIQEDTSREVQILLDIIDTAPSKQDKVDGIQYQQSQRYTGEMRKYMADFEHVLESLHAYSGIPWRVRGQEEFLSHPNIPSIVQELIGMRSELAKSFAPDTNCLALRAACPHDGCGMADKHGIRNKYNDKEKTIIFFCPTHGEHIVDITTVSGVSRLEFNTPLRNLLRALAFTRDPDATWIHVTGMDYAGYYQEQLLWRHLKEPFLTFYSPLIVDWSGSKLSKSLYVKHNAYKYLEEQKLDYMVSFEKFKEQGKDLRVIYDEVTRWTAEPFRLFRPYSIAYIDSLFSGSQERVE